MCTKTWNIYPFCSHVQRQPNPPKCIEINLWRFTPPHQACAQACTQAYSAHVISRSQRIYKGSLTSYILAFESNNSTINVLSPHSILCATIYYYILYILVILVKTNCLCNLDQNYKGCLAKGKERFLILIINKIYHL